jgi:WD40 repeat protein
MGCGSSSNSNASQPAHNKASAAPAKTSTTAAKPAYVPAAGEKVEDAKVEYDADIERELNAKKTDKNGRVVDAYERKENRPADNEAYVGFFEMESAGTGDQVMAVKPWIGAVKPPTNPPVLKNAAPSVELSLEYVYGYRCFDSRQNLYYTANPNEVVYMTAAIGVVLNKTANSQKFFGAGNVKTARGHTDDITALAVHPGRDIVATGEVGRNPKICVWSAANPGAGPTIELRLGNGARAVTCLGFSHDGKYLAAADLSNDHYVRVWEWQAGRQVFEDKGGVDKILDLAWSTNSHNFATVGIKHVCFWTIGATSSKAKGIFGSAGAMCNMTSATWLPDGTCITGGSNGMLYHWRERQLVAAKQVHPKGSTVHTVFATKTAVLSGGSDNKIRILDLSLNETRTEDLPSCPRAIDMHDTSILVGLRNGSIIEISGGRKTELMSSHFDGEVWGLAVSAASPNIVVTTGDDNTINVWDTTQRKRIGTAVLEAQAGEERKSGAGASTMAITRPNQQSRGVAINPRTGHVAIGFNDGHFSVRASVTNLTQVVTNGHDAKEWIEVIAYSPDGSRLAIGSHDNFIYIYDASNYRLLNKLAGHSSFILSLDWSVDGRAMHSTCGAYELLFWDTTTGKQVTDGATQFKDELWTTWTAKLGWPVKGIYGGVVDNTHVNAVDRAPASDLVAVGNDWGLVEIFGYPNSEQAKSQAFRAHSEHVMNVKWSYDSHHIFSAGGYDQTIMQWRRS